jgi:hypothetical protein
MSTEIIPFKEPRALAGLAAKLPAVFLPNKEAAERFFGFFTANHQNKNTRRDQSAKRQAVPRIWPVL